MMRHSALFLRIALAAAVMFGVSAPAQQIAPTSNAASSDVSRARRALADAREQGEAARIRAEKLEGDARRVTERVEKTVRVAAAVAARIQETEADIAARQAQIRLLGKQREQLRATLAQRQGPVVRLSAALQRLSRRPPVLALLRPGSVRDAVYLRALFDTMLPEVERRTAALRAEIEKGRELERRQAKATQSLQASEGRLRQRQQRLAAIESRQRIASRQAAGIASRESEKALALAEKAKDLGALVTVVGKQGELREELAALPGPIMRPPRPEESRVLDAESFDAPPQGLTSYLLPVSGRLVAGFGEEIEGRPPARGIVLAVRGGSQAVAPAAGRVAFAGPFQGYGRIVILEHEGGWTSLVTGLARLDADIGEQLVAGSPLGITAPGEPIVTLELRRNGEPVNPLQYLKTL
ncbi:MAG: peptidoglycan DD-metalloendopeptidase family protein [Sphingomonadaceae bacterium]|nr:peptidoglycan DD-metalloendopeptidase family protein [Sphingomonadaceae bacterium]